MRLSEWCVFVVCLRCVCWSDDVSRFGVPLYYLLHGRRHSTEQALSVLHDEHTATVDDSQF